MKFGQYSDDVTAKPTAQLWATLADALHLWRTPIRRGTYNHVTSLAIQRVRWPDAIAHLTLAALKPLRKRNIRLVPVIYPWC